MWSEEDRSQRWSIAFGLHHWIMVVGLLKLFTRMRKEGVQIGGENTEIYLEFIKIEMHLIHPTGM